MSETSPEPAPEREQEPKPSGKPFEPLLEERSYRDVFKSLLGRVFLVSNPESFEKGGLGPQIKAGWYKAKLVGMGEDYIITMMEFVHGSGKNASKEPMRQYIPLSRIKRISMMKSERLIHL